MRMGSMLKLTGPMCLRVVQVGGGADAVSHVILEVHYDNPDLEEGVVDQFGFEAMYVDEANMRPHDAAGLTLGDPALRMQVHRCAHA